MALAVVLATLTLLLPSANADSITEQVSVRSVLQPASIVLDAAGNPVVAFWDGIFGFPSGGELKLLHCNDPNCAGNDESIEVISTGTQRVGNGDFVSLVLDSLGNPVIAHTHDPVFAKTELWLTHCNDPNCAGGDESVEIVDTDAATGYYASLQLDSAGHPVVAYQKIGINSNNDIRILRCNDPNCAGGDDSITSPYDSGADTGSFASLVLDANEFPVVSFYERTSRTVKLLRCNDPLCAGGDDSITSPDTTGNSVGSNSALSLDAAGNPIIAYYDFTERTLAVTHCNDPLCAGGDETSSIPVPDKELLLNGAPSFVLDSAGLPVIVSTVLSEREFVVTRCNDPSCRGNNESTGVIDGVAWQYPTLTLDAAGHPVVAFWTNSTGQTNNGELNILHCDDPLCAGPAPITFCNNLRVTIDMNINGGDGTGTEGDDVILGTPGDDLIDGLGGDDTICGESGNDTITGGDGIDFIYGGDGDDEMTGGAGNDRIRGQQGIDVIRGGAGNDFLYGGIDGDTIEGGAGNDTIGGFGGDDDIDAGAGDDLVFGGFGADTIEGGPGDDRLRGLIGDDTIRGGADNDEIFGDNGSDTLFGEAGDDEILGGNSPDTIVGNAGDDDLKGGKGNDVLNGGPDTDTCAGNLGSDTAADCEQQSSIP